MKLAALAILAAIAWLVFRRHDPDTLNDDTPFASPLTDPYCAALWTHAGKHYDYPDLGGTVLKGTYPGGRIDAREGMVE